MRSPASLSVGASPHKGAIPRSWGGAGPTLSTLGLVQTYFRSKDDLLLFTVAHLGDLVNERVAAALSDSAEADIGEQLFRGMSVLAGADERGEESEGRIWLAFLARAVFHPALRAQHIAGAEEIRDRCQYAFELARSSGQVDSDLDTRAAAVAVAALADGITLQRALEPELVTKDVARELLRGYLDRIFTKNH